MIKFESEDGIYRYYPRDRIKSIERIQDKDIQASRRPWRQWRVRLVGGAEFETGEPTEAFRVESAGFYLLVPEEADRPGWIEWKVIPILAWTIEVTLLSGEPVMTEPIPDGICPPPKRNNWDQVLIDWNTRRARCLADGRLTLAWRHEITDVLAEALRISRRLIGVSDIDVWEQIQRGNPIHSTSYGGY